jgi:hypothetical protein
MAVAAPSVINGTDARSALVGPQSQHCMGKAEGSSMKANNMTVAITGPARWSTSPPPPPPPRLPISAGLVLPFPSIRRRAWIERQLANIAGYRPAAAKRHLAARIADRVRSLRNAGVAEDLIDADVAPVEQIFRDGLRFMFGQKSEVS